MTTIPEKGFLSLKQASHISGYHPDYLGLLIRKGKLKGKMVGRDWFIANQALENYFHLKKISLPAVRLRRLFRPDRLLGLVAWFFVLVGIGIFIFLGLGLNINAGAGDFIEPKSMIVDKIILGGSGGETIGRFNLSAFTNYSLDETKEVQGSTIPQP
ncbi:MAG: hypothetical protein Q8N16_02925 [bacterium]|nr:hypothetical protein [bacterium]